MRGPRSARRHTPAFAWAVGHEQRRPAGGGGRFRETAPIRVFLGHASVKTTSIYLASDEDRQEQAVQRRERGRPTLDDDRDA